MTKLTRELWLERGVRKLTQTFKAAGHTLPPVKVSCSWPGGRRRQQEERDRPVLVARRIEGWHQRNIHLATHR